MKPDVPNVLIAGPVNVRASLEQALGERGVHVHGCSFPDLIATCAGSSPRLVVLAGSMKGVELGMAATALAEHAATRAIPVVILTGEPGVPPARRPDAAPLTLVLSHQGLPAVATRLAELAASVPTGGTGGVIAESGGSSKSGGEPRLDDRLSPFLVGEPTEDTGSGPIRALHLHAPIENEPADPLTRSRDWTWEDSPQGTALTDDNDDQKAAKQRRLARTMMGVAPQGLGPSASDGASSGGEDGDMPAPAASRAGAWGTTKSDSVAPTGFPPARPLARAALRKAEPSTVGPLPGSDEEQAPVISPIVGPPRTAKPRPKTMLGVGLPSPAGAPAPPKPASKPRPRTMLGLGLGAADAPAPAPAAKPAAPVGPAAAPATPAASPPAASAAPAVTPAAASLAPETSQKPSSPGTVVSPATAAPPKRTPKFTPSAPMPAARPKSSGSLPAVRAPAVTPVAMPAVTAAAVTSAATGASSPAKSELPARKTGSPGPRRSANRTIMGGMGSPLAPPPPVNLPPSRPDDTAVVPTESDAPPSGPTGPAAAQFSSAASMDFTDEPTAVGDSAKQAAAKASGSSTQLAGADDFDDFDDFDLGLDHDEATQVLDQSSIAAAKLEALRAKSAQPDDTEFDTLPPPAKPAPEPPPAVAAALANKAPNLDDDFESAETEPPPPGVGIDGRIPEASLSLTDALELDDFESDSLGRTLSVSEPEESLDDGPVMGGAANPEPQQVRPQGYHQSFTGTEEDTEIVAGLTKKLDETEAKAKQGSGRGWLLATVAIVGVIGVAGGAWYMAPTLLGTVAHSEDTVESTPVPAAGEVTPTPAEPTPTTGTTPAEAPPSVPTAPAGEPPAAEPPAAEPPVAEPPVVAEAPPADPPAATPPTPTPPTPTPPAATPPTPTPPAATPPAAVSTAGLPSDPTEASAALVARADQQAGAGDRAGAEATLRRALTLDDENYEAMAKLAEVLVAAGQHDEALSLAQTAVRRRARVGRYHLIYGDVRAAMGDRSGASRSWSRAVDVDESLAAEAARRRSN